MFRWPWRRDAADFADEIRAHIEIEEARLRELGMSDADARRQARVRFGNTTLAAERVYETSPLRWIESLWQDIRYGARLLRRSPAFAVTAIVVLALGIGMSVALFSIVSSVFFRRMPIPEVERVAYVFLRDEDGTTRPDLTKDDHQSLRSAAGDLADFTSHVNVTMNISVGDEARVAAGELVEANYFDVLRLPMRHGRGFRPEDDDPSNPELSIVISHALWKMMFAGRDDVVGAQVRLRAQTYRIIGVTPEGFEGLASPWAPSMWWASGAQTVTGWHMSAIARLKAGVTRPWFALGVAVAGRRIVEETWVAWPPTMREKYPRARDRSFVVAPVADVQVPTNPDRRLIPTSVLVAVVVVVGLVLVIAATNVAGLLLARGTSRVGEVAVRQALGAAGGRLFRQVVTESVVLGLVGGIGGSALAFGLARAFEAFTPERFNAGVTTDVRVLAFAVLGCVVTGMFVGIAPAIQATRVSLLHALGAGVVGARRTGRGVRRWIVIPQVTVSLVLAVIAGVHVRTLRQVELRDLGYRTEGVTVLSLARADPNEGARPARGGVRIIVDDESRRRFVQSVLDGAMEEPGIGVVALADSLPIGSTREWPVRAVSDGPGASGGFEGPVSEVAVSERYFEAMGMRLVAGRSFERSDGAYGDSRDRVVVLSTTVAQAFGGAHAAVGQRIKLTHLNLRPDLYRVVGVVADVDPVLDDGRSHPVVYRFIRQGSGLGFFGYVITRSADPRVSGAMARRLVSRADPFVQVTSIRALSDMQAEILYPRRLGASILVMAAGIGLVLAMIGVYGVVAYSAAQRQREMGIRSTLGATRADILALVLREGVVIVGTGVSAGLVVAVGVVRATAGLVAGMPTVDVLAFTIVPVILAAVVLAACLAPALRASRVDPAVVLRGE